jgi:hypothetical protein
MATQHEVFVTDDDDLESKESATPQSSPGTARHRKSRLTTWMRFSAPTGSMCPCLRSRRGSGIHQPVARIEGLSSDRLAQLTASGPATTPPK